MRPLTYTKDLEEGLRQKKNQKPKTTTTTHF
jgi:hypothetical protein